MAIFLNKCAMLELNCEWVHIFLNWWPYSNCCLKMNVIWNIAQCGNSVLIGKGWFCIQTMKLHLWIINKCTHILSKDGMQRFFDAFYYFLYLLAFYVLCFLELNNSQDLNPNIYVTQPYTHNKTARKNHVTEWLSEHWTQMFQMWAGLCIRSGVP